jgi:hypothetical protein
MSTHLDRFVPPKFRVIVVRIDHDGREKKRLKGVGLLEVSHLWMSSLPENVGRGSHSRKRGSHLIWMYALKTQGSYSFVVSWEIDEIVQPTGKNKRMGPIARSDSAFAS